MKKQLSLALFVLAFGGILKADCPTGNNVWGHTYLQVRPVFTMAQPTVLTGFRDRALARCDGHGTGFQFVPFGGRTTNSKGLGRYFSPSPKNELVAMSTNISGQTDILRDINPEHFGIQRSVAGVGTNPATLGSFRSVIQFRPQQTTAGLGISWKQYLGWNDCCDRKWYLWLNTPITYVRNDMRLTEVVDTASTVGTPYEIAPGNVTPANMKEAFTGEFNGFLFPTTRLTHGKINGAQKKTGLGDIELFVGYDWLNSECCHLDTYFGVVIPTSNTPKGEYVFEPIFGNGNHFGLTWGSNYSADIWNDDCGDRSLSWELSFNYRYLFSKTSTRSFDLNNRPWSRYMLVFANSAANDAAFASGDLIGNVVPGINEAFTRKLKVTPRSQIDFNSGIVYESCRFRGEFGYNVWARQADKVCLKNAFVPGIAVADLSGAVDVAIPSKDYAGVNRLSNIGDNNEGGNFEYENATLIREQDLNLNSAGTTAALTNMVYGYLGYNWDDACYPTFIGAGASYEFSAVNTAVERWMVWGKIGFSL
jgi:hypothetical protein